MRNRNRHICLFWALWIIVFAGFAGPVIAEEAAPGDSVEFPQPDEKGGPEQLATIALYLLVAVTVLAVSMLILVMLWGVRVRRQIRKPLPAIKPTDPLWYLKAKKPPEGEP